MPAKIVHVTVTSKITGKVYIAPFSHHGGIQTRLNPTTGVVEFPVYVVPSYAVIVENGGTYNAVRFGLENKGEKTAEKSRGTIGLADKQTIMPSWRTDYAPVSFQGSGRIGAWRLTMEGHYIHEGTNRNMVTVIGASLGCVEILDSRWDTFLGEIEKLAGAPVVTIGKEKALKVSIESANRPLATFDRWAKKATS